MMIFQSVKKTSVFLLLFLSTSVAQSNSDLFNVTPYFGLKYFYWGEYNSSSIQNLEEFGVMFFAGINSMFKLGKTSGLYIVNDFNAYHGNLDYNGYLQDALGNTEPYKSTTEYWGIVFLMNMGYNLKISKSFIFAPEIGFEYEHWNRDIDDGGKYGYDELWQIFFLDFGSSFIFPLSKSSKIFLKVLGEYPLIINESVDLASRGQGGPADINLKPGANIGINIELGILIYGAFISADFDYLLFSSSIYDQGFHQPRSDRSVTGLKLGYSF